MQRTLGVLAFLICSAVCGAQAPAGLQTEWDIGVVLGEISAHAGRVVDALGLLDAKSWVAKGASETYVQQLESSRQQAQAIQAEAKELSAYPEKLSDSLKLFFRIEALENMLGSLDRGIAQYQSPAEAQALASLSAENGTNRERFRQYIVNLAADRENQFAIMDAEAQRCRGILAAQPLPAPARAPRKK